MMDTCENSTTFDKDTGRWLTRLFWLLMVKTILHFHDEKQLFIAVRG